MKIKKEPIEIWQEYQNGVAYNEQFNLYQTVEQNNNFYNDKQWEGVYAPDLDKPVLNFLKPIAKYYIAMIISDDISANVELRGNTDKSIANAISEEIKNIMEHNNMQYKNRQGVRNAAVDGDTCYYNWFDPEEESGQLVPGQIKTDLIDNTNVIFGDPSERESEKQPYILIIYRSLTENVKEEAKENGMGEEDINNIVPDNDSIYMNGDKNYDKNYTTVILKMWKIKKKVNEKIVKSVNMIKCTQTVIIKKEWDTDYRRYPISYMGWESVKNSYHGISPLTGIIQNQIFTNKMYSMAMMFTSRMAFPKIIYDASKIPQGWDNRVGVAIAVQGSPTDAIFNNFQSADMSASVPNMITSTITQTKELSGVNDTVTGNVRPDNTSAIVALQNQAKMQLDMQRLDFNNCVEGYIRSYIDMMRVHYGVREIETTVDNEKAMIDFNFAELGNYLVNLKIDVGQSSYWSEIMQLQILDNMWTTKIIPDAVIYLESLPDGIIKDRQGLIDKIRSFKNPITTAGIPTQQALPPAPVDVPLDQQGLPNVVVAETDEMKKIIEELSTLKPKQILNMINAMSISDEEKAGLVNIMKARGKL
jgi:hypothetical protein